MAKNPSKKAVGKDEPMNGAMKFFLAGCVAELYLLILRRFYVNAGSDVARFAWYDHYLWILAGVGAGVMAVCAVGALALRKDPKRRTALWIAAAAGLFLGAAALLVRWNMATLSFQMCIRDRNRVGLKIASLALVCALLGGLVGGGTAYLVGNHSGSDTTEVNVSNRKPTEIQVKTVDGKTPMTDAELYASNVKMCIRDRSRPAPCAPGGHSPSRSPIH